MDPAPGSKDEAKTIADKATAIFINRNNEISAVIKNRTELLISVLARLENPQLKEHAQEANDQDREKVRQEEREYSDTLSAKAHDAQQELLLLRESVSAVLNAFMAARNAYNAAIATAAAEPSPETRTALYIQAAEAYYDAAVNSLH